MNQSRDSGGRRLFFFTFYHWSCDTLGPDIGLGEVSLFRDRPFCKRPTFSTNQRFILEWRNNSPSWSRCSTMAAAARLLLRSSAAFKASVTDVCVGVQGSSAGLSLLRFSPSCSLRLKTQKRHAAHFTFHPDPVPTTYGTLNGVCVCVEESRVAPEISALVFTRSWC